MMALQTADEGDWLDMLVASERIDKWLDTIASGPAAQKKQAVFQLAEEVAKREAYAEEAKSAGAIDILTKLLSKTDEEEVVTACAKIIAACSGPLAHSHKAQEVHIGPHTVWIQEGALSDGLGARIWNSAHILCRQLVSSPEQVQGKDVLELGSGCGLVGILAARLGASQVTLTDYDATVLSNLWACVLGNTASHKALAGAEANWQTENMRVRFLDWSEALEQPQVAAIQSQDSIIARQRASSEPSALEPGVQFEAIIGSDLIYESYQADMVAAVVSQRLAKDGTAHFALAIRRKEHLDRLKSEADRHGLTVEVQQATVDPRDGGILGREHEYEGGFVIAELRFKG